MKVLTSFGERPHFTVDCWCRPVLCECCDHLHHRSVLICFDEQPRMTVFSDQRAFAG